MLLKLKYFTRLFKSKAQIAAASTLAARQSQEQQCGYQNRRNMELTNLELVLTQIKCAYAQARLCEHNGSGCENLL